MRAIIFVLAMAAAGAYASGLDSIAVCFAAATPALRAERAQFDADYREALDENILEGPEAEFEYKFGDENRWGVAIGQGFDWPGLYAARREANKVRANTLSHLYKSRLSEKALDIKLAVLRYCRARALRDLRSDVAANFQLMKNTYATSLKRGECTILDLRRVEVECFKAAAEGREAESELKAATIALETLGGDALISAIKDFSYQATAPLPYATYRDALENNSPSTAYHRNMAALADAESKVASRSALPSFKVSFIHDFEENMHFNGFGIGVSLPTWNGKYRRAAARSRALAAAETFTDYRLLADAQLYADYEQAESIYATIKDAGTTFSDDEYPALLKKALDAGKITLYEYLADYLEFAGAKITFTNLLYDYADTDARLSRHIILAE